MRVEANSEQAAVHEAAASGAAVLSVRREQVLPFARGWGRAAVPLLLLSQELLALLRAGIGLVESFETLAEKEQSPATRAVLAQILEHLHSGKSLSAALEAHPHAFPPLFVASVRASERTGTLTETLGRYVAYRQQIEAARKKIATALVYPALLLAVGALVTLFLLGYVVPRFSRIFEDRMGDAPLMTRVLIGWGGAIDRHPFEIAAAVLGAIVLLAWAGSRPAARALALRALQALPRVGERLRLFELGRMYRTLGMLLRSGMPAVPALGMVRGLMQESLRASFDRATARIREGLPISTAMADAGLTNPVAVRMLRVGEQAGNMGEMMERLAELYDEENARAVELFSRTFEPILMAVIGLVIGSIVVLMYLPIFELAANIQ
ncbi:MAG: type II secretion system F family protein [Burkholderiales bacterium]|nr:type II secretion system F family protein [Burkholderiales bacterium]